VSPVPNPHRVRPEGAPPEVVPVDPDAPGTAPAVASPEAVSARDPAAVPEVVSASDPAAVERAVAALQTGGVVILPTETVYGLAALPTVDGATARLFALKGRGAHVPVAVLCAHADQALALADDPDDPDDADDQVRAVAAEHWPGPLTLVLRRRPGLGYELGDPADTVGVRCPDHPLVQALARRVGPIATTSANPHGRPTPREAREAAAPFGPGVALVVDGGPCGGTPSTVVDATDRPWKVLRQGALTLHLP
jgi:L-threonylcarbamoyladenylate synthase